jgi:hypothetical protein
MSLLKATIKFVIGGKFISDPEQYGTKTIASFSHSLEPSLANCESKLWCQHCLTKRLI